MDSAETTTSGPPPHENEILTAPDPKAKLRRRRAEFWQICGLIVLASLLISLYSVILSQRLAPAASQHDLDDAALAIASDLSTLTVKHQRLGLLGLVDLDVEKHSQIGLNRLQAILRVNGIASRQLGLDSMHQFLTRDADAAAHMSRELARLERELANPKAAPRLLGRDSLREIVHKVLGRSGAGGRLKSLSISLGALRNSKYGSRTPLPAVADEETEPYASGHDYKTHFEVPIWGKNSFQFYETADSVRLVPASQFVSVPENSLASVVLVEASFEVAERGRVRRIQKMQSCAIVGAPPLDRPGSVFMLSFPQGYLSRISRFRDLLSPQTYAGTKGEWLEAVEGDVPGPGSMAPVGEDMPVMSPDLAAMNALYHFMFNVGPGLVPANLNLLLNESIGSIQVNGDNNETASPFNSGLFKDTKAARFALLKQSQPGGGGQAVLKNAFSNKSVAELMPPYTFPLTVDSLGSLSLPQDRGFNLEKISEFLNSLYLTNIAGIESMQIADTVAKRMNNSILLSDNKIASLKEELQSIKHSIELLRSNNVSDAERDRERKPLINQFELLRKGIKDEELRKSAWLKIKSRAAMVKQNARMAARSTYEIGTHMSSFASQGLKKITAPIYGFLLGRYVAFTPCTAPVDEDDLYEPADYGNTEVYKKEPSSEWLKPDFKVTAQADNKMFVEDTAISEYWKKTQEASSNRPLYLMLSSHELLSSKTPSLFAARQSPFDNTAISKSQLCYFAPQSIITGDKSKVAWSMLLRDLVYSYQDEGGSPSQSLRPRWCLDLGMDEESCPGLAVELQIRTPVPKMEGSLSASYLQDPDGGPSVALYPPLPPELI